MNAIGTTSLDLTSVEANPVTNFDAMHKWLEAQETNGAFTITFSLRTCYRFRLAFFLRRAAPDLPFEPAEVATGAEAAAVAPATTGVFGFGNSRRSANPHRLEAMK